MWACFCKLSRRHPQVPASVVKLIWGVTPVGCHGVQDRSADFALWLLACQLLRLTGCSEWPRIATGCMGVFVCAVWDTPGVHTPVSVWRMQLLQPMLAGGGITHRKLCTWLHVQMALGVSLVRQLLCEVLSRACMSFDCASGLGPFVVCWLLVDMLCGSCHHLLTW